MVSWYYPWLEVLLCSFNGITFTLLAFLWFREYRRYGSHWGGHLYLYLTVACAVLFVSNVLNYLSVGLAYHDLTFLVYPQLAANALLPSLLYHFFYRNEREGLPARRMWLAGLFAVYALGIWFVVLALGALGRPHQDYLGDKPTLLAYRALMVAAAAGSGLVLWASRRPVADRLWRSQRRLLLLLSCAWACIYLFPPLRDWSALLAQMLPLCFAFVVTYYVERPTFFDVLIKKGAFTFCSLILLAAYFLLLAPLLLRLWWGTRTAVLAWALLVLPIVLLAPWGQRELSAWLDRLFLGRRYLPAQAAQYFLTELQSAVGESELAGRAEQLLGEVFHSQAQVLLGPEPLPPPGNAGAGMQAPIGHHGRQIGLISILPRVRGPRFLSEDVALLSSLAETYSFLLDNLRLREERAQREGRERNLLLEAQRSELRALRAQINPHFMFNALNTIAGLIPRRPDRAERTIEQLAEVFRYTLRRSEREWVPLDEELEAVRAYLDIERTRFGDRLEFTIRAGDEAEGVRIPAMIVQTLVENAVKHGVGAIRVPGRIEVNVEAARNRLRIEVRDNGPGFEESAAGVFHQPGEGHGLRNIRERLRGYFGDAARLSVARDGTPASTVVAIEMPRTTQALEVAP
jgi:signal transduction histidine kinase